MKGSHGILVVFLVSSGIYDRDTEGSTEISDTSKVTSTHTVESHKRGKKPQITKG